ncbi:hypothetical protein V6N12_012013 [Hibiscus sabdariffa]|uniref:Fringe-like glycosyltransferase domain-containing protein n=1 Tax=Hibiscus sabdariffa TaxID=183260 RepID=A0ABR2CGW4_9ROSI
MLKMLVGFTSCKSKLFAPPGNVDNVGFTSSKSKLFAIPGNVNNEMFDWDSRAASRNSLLHQEILLLLLRESATFLGNRLQTPRDTRAVAFLDQPLSTPAGPNLPPVVVSSDTRLFPYTFKSSLRSAIRVARVVKEAVDRNEMGIRWFVFGDDDTVFVVDNLVEVLSKYDHDKWYYVGSSSESYEQNVKYSCLMRYGHLYGSDSRIWACLVELGVGLTHEPGFHQVDVRGNFFGMLTAQPLSPLLSLHHLDAMEPIFPNMDKTRALEHFFKAVTADSSRILLQTVCYENFNSLTVSVAWGYAIQTTMLYTRHSDGKCRRSDAIKHLKEIRVVSHKLELDIEQMMAPRQQCCEISASHDELMVVDDRKCGADELISMNV